MIRNLSDRRFLYGLWIVLAAGSFAGGAYAQSPRVDPQDLPPKFRHFYEVAYWIMTDHEKNTFLRLQDDRLRSRFIELFWGMRDPTPGTPENEYREEMERRFAHVNRYFRFGGRPGWKTDRGRVYMVLGPPRSTEHFSMSLELYDTEVWYYYGEGRPGLPSHFSVLFYRPRGLGDFKQYSYTADGPYELLIHRENLDPLNYAALYQKIREIEPSLAPVVLSPIPGEIPFNFQPSPEADQIMARIMDAPKAEIDDSYALKFERYAGLVDIEEANRFISAKFYSRLQWMPELGYPVFQYAIQPGTVSIGRYEDRFYVVFQVHIQFEDRDTGKTVLQVAKQFQNDLGRSELDAVRRGGVILVDQFPVLPGRYHVKFLLKNTVNREFSFWESDVDVVRPEYPYMDPPFLAVDARPGNPVMLTPFQLGVYRYSMDLNPVYVPDDQLIAASRIYVKETKAADVQVTVRVETRQPGRPARTLLTQEVPTNPSTVPDSVDWFVMLPLNQWSPGRFTLVVEAAVGGRRLGVWRLPFTISPSRGIARPVGFIKSLPWANIFLWNMMAGDFAARLDHWPEAIEWYRRSVSQKPAYFQAVKRLLDAYIMNEQYDDALQLLAQVQGVPAEMLNLYRMLAVREQSIDCSRQLPALVKFYNKGYRHWRLLREIGLCLYHQGKKEQARRFLQDTLHANPNQKDIPPLLETPSSRSPGALPNRN